MAAKVGGGYSNQDNTTRYRYVGEVPGQPGQPGYSPLQELMKAAWSRMGGAMGARDWFKTGWADPKGKWGGSGGSWQTPTTPPPGGQGSTGTKAAAPPTEERRYTPGQTPGAPPVPRSAPAPGFGEAPTPAPPGGTGGTRPPSGSAVPEPGEQPSPPGYNPPRTQRPPDERTPQMVEASTGRRENAGGEWNPLTGDRQGKSASPGFGEKAVDWGRTHDGKPPSEKDGAAEGDSWKSPDGKVYVYKGGTWTAHDGSTWSGSSGPPVGGGSGDDNGNGGNAGGAGTPDEDGSGKTPDNRDPDAPPVDPSSGYYYPWNGVPPEWNGTPGGGPGAGEGGPGGLIGYYMNELGSSGYDPEVMNAMRASTMGAVGNQANAARDDMARRVAATGNDAGYFGALADVTGSASQQAEEAGRQNILANEQERARRNAIGIGGMQTLSDQEREDEQAWARFFAGLATKPREVEGEQSGTNISLGFGF